MAFSRKGSRNTVQEVVQIPVEKLHPNAAQPRTCFDSQSLRELAMSIEQHGILQPLSVRRVGSQYELIAGERRLRAARLAGLSCVPCIIIQVDDKESSLLSLIENVQRRDLDYFEVAQGYQRLMQRFGLTQEQVALRVGKTQSAVANKLRLLRFDAETIAFIRAAALTERHCRAVLRLPPALHRSTLEQIAAQTLTVAQTDQLVDSLTFSRSPDASPAASYGVTAYISSRSEEHFGESSASEADSDTAPSPPVLTLHSALKAAAEAADLQPSEFTESSCANTNASVESGGFSGKKNAGLKKSEPLGGKLLVKDARIFLNTILRAFDVMKASGIDALCQQREEVEYTELLIRIPRRPVENGKKSP